MKQQELVYLIFCRKKLVFFKEFWRNLFLFFLQLLGQSLEIFEPRRGTILSSTSAQVEETIFFRIKGPEILADGKLAAENYQKLFFQKTNGTFFFNFLWSRWITSPVLLPKCRNINE